ncbi:hypothetical protein MNBD_NITROSPINAE03-1943 [hydrothermal vent metagenome]|uniref:Uncharacterized protein n=1 Tax=hydrothermal vent metagenome TaxID=652676 RepID=A0A3B1CAP3_9ZZZZ
MIESYQIAEKTDTRKIAWRFAGDGEPITPMVPVIDQIERYLSAGEYDGYIL